MSEHLLEELRTSHLLLVLYKFAMTQNLLTALLLKLVSIEDS